MDLNTIRKQAYVFIGTTLKEDKFNEVTNNEFFCKPHGGLWLSKYEEIDSYISKWDEYIHEEGLSLSVSTDNKQIVNISNSANIYIIDSLEDLKRLYESYSVNASKKYFRKPHNYINFEKMAVVYDGIYLTEHGQWKTRLSEPNLYGWDIESLLVLNKKIIFNTRNSFVPLTENDSK